MACEWKFETIESLLQSGAITGHKDGNHGSQYPRIEEFGSVGVPFLTAKSLAGGRIDIVSAPRLADDKASKLRLGFIQTDDVLLSHNATVGRVAVVPEFNGRLLIGTSLTYFRLNRSKLSPHYFAACLAGADFQNQLAAVMSQTTRNQVPITAQRRLSVAVPPPATQSAIANILGTLDDKIELNRRMNETLEGMARAIFKSWFVDFDPMWTKADGRQPAGMAAVIAARFPDSFEDSLLGKIPRGWMVTSLADEIRANKGLSYKGEHLCESGEGLPMHNLNSVHEGGGYKNAGLKWYKGEHRPAHLLKPGDVIVTNTEQGFDYLLIGYAAIVPERYGSVGLFSHHIYRIQPTATSYLPTWFTYLLLRTPSFHEIVAGYSNGTTVNMLPLDGLQKPRFVLPPEDLVEQFGKLFAPIQKQLDWIHDENVTLSALRDALLPKLLSGEIRVPEAENHVEAMI